MATFCESQIRILIAVLSLDDRLVGGDVRESGPHRSAWHQEAAPTEIPGELCPTVV